MPNALSLSTSGSNAIISVEGPSACWGFLAYAGPFAVDVKDRDPGR